jgi:DNA polymerase III subunit alpha, Gram-positive type
MQDKMKRLLDQIGMNTDYLEKATIKKIVVYDNNKLWNFIIENDKILPVYIYTELINKIKINFSTIEDIKLSVIVREDNDEYINDYIDNLINIFSNDSYKYRVFIGRNVNVIDNKYVFEVYNKAENSYLIEKLNYINNCLRDYGFNKNLELSLVEEKENELLKEIESEKVVEDPKVVISKKETASEVKTEEKKYFRPKKDTSVTPIKDLMYEVDNITIEGVIFGMDMFESKSGYKIITLKVTDNNDSIYVKMFTKDNDEYARIKNLLKVGSWYNFYGKVAMDKYSNELTFTTRYKDVEKIEKPVAEKIVDDAPVKRVELHAHTMMSQMDGITGIDLGKHTCELVSKCIDMGYRGVAITDHSGCQAFPIAYGIISGHNKGIEDPSKHFKGLYGTELTVVDDTVDIVVRSDDRPLSGTTFVVFDTETTGFNAGGTDQMIEIGAVKIKDGNIIDRFDELIDPGRHIPDKITALTCITDEMVKGKDNEENVTKRFLAWTGDLPMVAHNAKFDISFISSAMKKYNLGEFKSTVIDTLELSRAIDTGYSRHSLSALVKRYNVPWEEDAHHRADYDAEGTAYVFHKMISKLTMQNLSKISDLDKLIPKDEIYKFGRTYHFNAIALNKKGLKNLFKIISLANTT